MRAACRIVLKMSADGAGRLNLTVEKINNGKPFETRYFEIVNHHGGSSVVLKASDNLGNNQKKQLNWNTGQSSQAHRRD